MRCAIKATFAVLLLCPLLLLGTACDPAVPAGEITGECDAADLAKGGEEYFNDTMVPQVFEPYCSYCHWSDKVTPEERKGATVGLNYDNFESVRRGLAARGLLGPGWLPLGSD